MAILLRRQPIVESAESIREEITASVSPREIRAFGAAPRRRQVLSERSERRREAALASLVPAVEKTADLQQPVVTAVQSLGGRVEEQHGGLSFVVAVVPRVAIPRLAARHDVQAIRSAPAPQPLALGDYSRNVGAGSWWAAGHTGGTGSADTSAADIAIEADPSYHAHPAFAGIRWQQTPTYWSGNQRAGSTHGTGVTSMAVSRGATACALCVPTDAAEKGIAPGVDSVLDTSGNGDLMWALGVPWRSRDPATGMYVTWPAAADPAEVVNYSRGLDQVTYDDDLSPQSRDAYVDTYGVTITIAAGNAGPAQQTVNDPAIAYNAIAVGGASGTYTGDPLDDTIYDWSSRGPTVGGRKKPDLVATGGATVAYSYFETTGQLWKSETGTSYAAPQVAGAAALLAGIGINDPRTVKGLLINSARQGRATPAAAMGTQTGWQPDWGWGMLDLTTALAQRANFASDAVPAGGARFFRATTQSAGDRATLVWHRRASDCDAQHAKDGCVYDPDSGAHVFTHSNLDLAQLDPATGAVEAASTSAVDNVEQVRSPGTGSVIYKVTAGGVDGLPGEPFSIVGTQPVTPLVTPQPTVHMSVSGSGPRRAGESVTVTATVANPSPDLTAESAQVRLDIPAGVEITSGAQTRTLGTLATQGGGGSSQTLNWTVRGTTDGIKQLAATASASRYGSTFASTATAGFAVDAAGPVTTLAAPTGTSTSTAMPISWGATDAGSGVSSYDVEVSLNGAPFAPWIWQSSLTAATYEGNRGNRYSFRSRAIDLFGNVSAWVTSAEVTLVAPAEPPTGAGEPPPSGQGAGQTGRAVPGLKLVRVRRRGSRMDVRASIDAEAPGYVKAQWLAKVGRKSYRVSAREYIYGGNVVWRLSVPAKARSAKRATLTLTYAGARRFAAQTVRVSVTTRSLVASARGPTIVATRHA